ncbi:iron-containing alcohol dehydrogenase [Pseudonocardia alni]|uniref:iron-containing alcohol dehydrogenase n=1 Tax=Pseudonocardia alni TaxID=33907 RepID=UPI003405C6DC
MSTSINQPSTMRIGPGALDALPEILRGLGSQRPLIVTDPFLAGQGWGDRILEPLSGTGIQARVFSETIPDPTTTSLRPGLEAAVLHDADCVVGFGGGSPIDTAKALALLARQGGPMREFKAPRRVTEPALPIVAIPTTAGSGSEATQFTIITDADTDEKMLCAGPSFLPAAAIVDVELTMSMPPRLSADTGVDALTHAVEAYVSRKANPFTDGVALTAMAAIPAALRRVWADGADREARETMMLAATQAGIAFSNASVALVHGMSRPIGGHFHVAHGLSNAMLFPAVCRFSVGAAESRYADCARAIGAATPADDDAKAALALVEAVGQLCSDLDVPTPESYGIDRSRWEERIPVMAQQALASGSPGNNPLVPSLAEIERLYLDIYR